CYRMKNKQKMIGNGFTIYRNLNPFKGKSITNFSISNILNNINSRVKRKRNTTSITYRPPLSIDDDDSTLEFSNNRIIHFIRYNGSYLDLLGALATPLISFLLCFVLKFNFFLVTFI